MSELKHTDLRIGNILKRTAFVESTYKWGGIQNEYYDECEVTIVKENLVFIAANLYFHEPIPLSVEWLKKAGYKQLKRVEKTYSLSNFEDNSAIYFTGVRFIHIKTNVHIEYVHELQQLHSVLFKEELKFNL